MGCPSSVWQECQRRWRMLSSAVFASSTSRAPRSRSAMIRRSPTTFSVISWTRSSTPPMPVRLIGYRTVRDGEVRLLDEAVATDLQDNVVIPSCRPPIEWCVDALQRPKDVPDFIPALAAEVDREPTGVCAEYGAIRVVVDGHVLWSPPQQQWESGSRVENGPSSAMSGDHVPAEPMVVFDQSNARMRSPISPPPASQSPNGRSPTKSTTYTSRSAPPRRSIFPSIFKRNVDLDAT